MIYLFACPECGNECNVWCTLEHRNDKRNCSECGAELKRVITAPALHIFTAHYNRGLGKHINRSSEITDTLQRHYDNTGQKLEPAGDGMTASKPDRDYKFSKSEMRDMHQILKSAEE